MRNASLKKKKSDRKGSRAPVLGLALGGGTLRGMAHLGVLEVFEENGIRPQVLTGCSSGAIVAASYACKRTDELKKIALSIKRKDRRKMLDFCLTGKGIIRGGKLLQFFEFLTDNKDFEDIKDHKLAFVATDVETGDAVVINKGSIAKALQMATAVPGITPLQKYEGRLVFDGGTAMLVPAKLAYEHGADKVIAVDVSVGRSLLTRVIGDLRKIGRKGPIGKIVNPVISIQNRIQENWESEFLKRSKAILRKTKLLYDVNDRELNMVETYLLGLRAISRDYERGLFRDEDCNLALRPDVLDVKRVDVEKTEILIEKGREAARIKIGEIRRMTNNF